MTISSNKMNFFRVETFHKSKLSVVVVVNVVVVIAVVVVGVVALVNFVKDDRFISSRN